MSLETLLHSYRKGLEIGENVFWWTQHRYLLSIISTVWVYRRTISAETLKSLGGQLRVLPKQDAGLKYLLPVYHVARNLTGAKSNNPIEISLDTAS